MLDYEPVSSHQAQAFVSDKPGPRPPRRGGSSEGADHHSRVKQQIFLTYREQGPCPVNPDFRIIEHGCTGCTGLTGRAAGAQDADWLNNGLKSRSDNHVTSVSGSLFLVLFQISSAPAPHDGADHSRVKQGLFQIRHEDRWTSFNDNWRQNASALLSRWRDPVMGGSPPGSAGVPPAQILPQLHPSPPPESTGSGALPLLRPGPCGSRRQGGRLQHRRETERQPKGQHAGGTPALPGVSSR